MIEEAEVVDAEGQELEPYRGEVAPSNLFGVSDPVDVIKHATTVATALKRVVQKQGLVTEIQGRPHPRVEAWTLLGSMLGVFPIIVWSHPIEKEGKLHGWEARCEARTRDGGVIGSAEAMCTRDEAMWSWHPTGRNGQKLKPRDDHALRAMAQTRARSKALSGPLGFVMSLAGYEATPAEEMPQEPPQAPVDGITDAQHRKIGVLLKELNEAAPPAEGQASWVDELRAEFGVRSRKELTKADAGKAIEWLEGKLEDAKIPFG